MLIKSRAPLRLGLAGGGTDVSPYCDINGGYVLNATIDRYAYAVINTLDNKVIRFIAADLFLEETHELFDALEIEGKLKLHRAVYSYMVKHFNNGQPLAIELSTFCDAPAGSGLGSSSAIVVAMIRAFIEYLNIPMDDYAMALLAFRIERVECSLLGGRQDQYAASFGGFNFIEFYENERVVVNSLRIKNWILNELEASLVLYFTGVSRESAQIILDQSKSIDSGSYDVMEAMHGIKREALEMKECLVRGDFNGVVKSMLMGWENKKRSAKTISNAYIDEIYASSLQCGALAGKISGAGGGGFMLFFVPIEHRMKLIRNLDKFDGQVSNCHFTDRGAEAWRIS
jgi:D-glycero-alpha-D-manno-heptose-7-phosphate kinase